MALEYLPIPVPALMDGKPEPSWKEDIREDVVNNTAPLDAVWRLNERVPDRVQACAHEVIAGVAKSQPDSLALDAWDGRLTYRDLEATSSRLARHLVTKIKIERGRPVLLIFERSLWTTISALAVMKAGAPFLIVDTHLPFNRLQSMAGRLGAQVALSSPKKHDLACRLSDTVVPTHRGSEAICSEKPLQTHHWSRRNIDPSSTLYLVFTSGSTGSPKAVMVSHANLITSMASLSSRSVMGPQTRQLDFAAYSFDMATFHIFSTLTTGGCLCVPSDEDRRNRLSDFVNEMKINFLALTPTALRMLEPHEIPAVKTLLLAGERCDRDLAIQWRPHVKRLINAYGPAECTFLSTVYDIPESLEENIPIGHGVGCAVWIANPANPEDILPIGHEGELLIEGPIVGQGYFGQPDQTKASFLDNPSFLRKGSTRIPGRRGRVYRTGDLGRINENGKLMAHGRKDNQRKLRGQRLELEEVEHCIREVLPGSQVIAEVLCNHLNNSAEQLVAFVRPKDNRYGSNLNDGLFLPKEYAYGVEDAVQSRLAETLPFFMVPSVVMLLRYVPQTPTGKTDRRRLCEALKLEIEASRENTEYVGPATSREVLLRDLWAGLLQTEPGKISRHDHFLRLGGDSVTAVKLSNAVRFCEASLSVQDILNSPILADMASEVRLGNTGTREQKKVAPFSMVPDITGPELIHKAALKCDVLEESIEDIYPCTPLQEGLMALSEHRPGTYITRRKLQVGPDADGDILKNAWKTVLQQNEITRTRIISLDSQGLVQVVLRDAEEVNVHKQLPRCHEIRQEKHYCLGKPLYRVEICWNPQDKHILLVAHHAVCDGVNETLILDQVDRVYKTQDIHTGPRFNQFVHYVNSVDRESLNSYWRAELSGPAPAIFPPTPAKCDDTWATRVKEHIMCLDAQRPVSGFTMATHVRLAWALLCSQYTGSDDVVFGETLSGRNAPVENIEKFTGPTITTVPNRIKINWNLPVSQSLKDLHHKAVEMIPFEQAGLSNIRKLGPEAARACDFQTLLIIQSTSSDFNSSIFRVADEDSPEALLRYANLPLTVEVTPLEEAKIRFRVAHNEGIIDANQINRLLQQLDHIMKHLYIDSQTPLRDFDRVGPSEMEEIHAWNSHPPRSADERVHDLVARQTILTPAAPAVYSWDASLTYSQLDSLSSRLADFIRGFHIGPQVVIPLLFEKSSIPIVAILGVLKSGNAFFTLDGRQPTRRLSQLIARAGSNVLLVSEKYRDVLELHSLQKIVISRSSLYSLPHRSIKGSHHPSSIDAPTFVVFTSGSTGEPKGIVLQHRALSTMITSQAPEIGLNQESRVLQFASPAFDMSAYEALMTLSTGGCICVPSDEQRLSDPSGFAREAAANTMMICPSAVRAMTPGDIPSMRTVVLVGEPIPSDIVDTWGSQCFVINGYGPAECTICSTIPVDATQRPLCTIGRPKGCRFWIVDPRDFKRLVPIGTVGELLIEGPVLAKEYLHDEAKTRNSFVENPPWMALFREEGQGRLYRTGDLAKYNSDGTVVYLGRKDAQVKLWGQRIELGDVEHHLSQTTGCPAAAGVVEYGNNEHLTAFIPDESPQHKSAGVILPPNQRVRQAKEILSELRNAIPEYMIPSVYLPVSHLPTTSSGKLDRKSLVYEASQIGAEGLPMYQDADSSNEPSTHQEFSLRDVWGQLLGLTPEIIKANHNFFHIGGDSIQAVNLVSIARRKSRSLNVMQVFQCPCLRDMARHWDNQRRAAELAEKDWPAYAILRETRLDVFLEHIVCRKLAVSRDQIIDVYPSPNIQTSAVKTKHNLYNSFAVKRP